MHLVSLPMDDADENAAMVNAIQRRADVVVQKSLAEGFGLTVAEAMWKARPVVGSRVGGIQDQIADGETGLLVEPLRPRRLRAGDPQRLLADEQLAARLGAAARERIRQDFLEPAPPRPVGRGHLDAPARGTSRRGGAARLARRTLGRGLVLRGRGPVLRRERGLAGRPTDPAFAGGLSRPGHGRLPARPDEPLPCGAPET